MRAIKKLIRYILLFADKLQNAHIGAYSAQAAYFTVLSAIPLLMLLLALIQYTPLTKETIIHFLGTVIPEVIMPFVKAITEEVYTKSVTLISIAAIVAFWSGARGILAITTGFNNIYGINETRNYFILRIRASFSTLLLLTAIVFAMTLVVFSEQRLIFLGEKFPIVETIVAGLGKARFVFVILVELLMFMFLYKLLPNRKGHLLWQIPGSLFTAVGWSVFSYFFSKYIGKFSNMSYIYGSLTTVIVLMLWLYFCMYILLIGAGINACIERYPRWRKWEKFTKDKDDK